MVLILSAPPVTFLMEINSNKITQKIFKCLVKVRRNKQFEMSITFSQNVKTRKVKENILHNQNIFFYAKLNII